MPMRRRVAGLSVFSPSIVLITCHVIEWLVWPTSAESGGETMHLLLPALKHVQAFCQLLVRLWLVSKTLNHFLLSSHGRLEAHEKDIKTHRKRFALASIRIQSLAKIGFRVLLRTHCSIVQRHWI